MFSQPQLEWTSSNSSTQIYVKIPDKQEELILWLVWDMLLFHGVQVEPLLESLELQVVVHKELVKLLLVTWPEKVECSLHLKPGEDGIEKLT